MDYAMSGETGRLPIQVAEQATFTPTALPGIDYLLPACDLCGAYVARRDLHEQWHRQFVHTVDSIAIEWVTHD